MRAYRIIDADQHIIEPPDLWRRWLPKKFHDRAPRLGQDEDGGDAWILGDSAEPLGLVTIVGKPYAEFRWTGVRYADVDPGCYEPRRRLELLDIDGIDAALIYPPQRTMGYFITAGDREFHLAGIEAFNNWLTQEFCAVAPERLGAIAQIPNAGIEAAVAELRRAKTLGARGVSITTWPSGNVACGAADDPFWAAAEEAELPVSIHIALVTPATPRQGAGVTGGARKLFGLASTMSFMPRLIAEMIFAGVFDRFPNLRMVANEVGAGWVPSLLQDLDDRYWRNRRWAGVRLVLVPSEYFRRNWVVGFIRDPYGIRNRHDVGIANMMWASDFPHHINDWPYSRRLITEMSLGVPEDERRKLFCDNAGRLYRFVSARPAQRAAA
ncbi:MAG: amidohydrolase family protein [Candidatus Binatia bacterium]